VELLDAGPSSWAARGLLDLWALPVLIWREFGMLYNCQYVCTLLYNLEFSFQKARFVSDPLDAAPTMASAGMAQDSARRPAA